jgi:ABC-type oligopeptide transport system substrate-binding subunit
MRASSARSPIASKAASRDQVLRRPRSASDFRRAFERLFRTGSPGADYYRSILGAARCEAAPATCNLATGVVTNDAARTITVRLVAPDPQFLFKLAVFAFSAPIPPGVPYADSGLLASVRGGELELVDVHLP